MALLGGSGKATPRHQEREQQIKLLFHPKRPGVGIGIELGRFGEILNGFPIELNIRNAEERPAPDPQDTPWIGHQEANQYP